MIHSDEPLFKGGDIPESPAATANPAVRERIRQLTHEQPYGVLCVQGGGQAYGALVAFAFSEDMQHAVFVTPVATREYRLLSECDHVALVIDNRPDRLGELMEIERSAGRVRTARNGPRTLDLDLLTLGELELSTDRLQLPHPRMWQRRFVLAPLAEVAPELRNPATGRTAAEEATRLNGAAAAFRIGRLAPARRQPV